ncbi:MAG: LacI family DNA-binding transcriptional regulator [Armatimonadota bacterium]
MRIVDIARELNLSYTTVALTLSGKGNRYGIAQATQARILDYAEQVGYVKDLDAAKVTLGATNQVGIIFPLNPTELNENQRAMFFLLQKALQVNGLVPVIQPVDQESFMRGMRFLIGKRVSDIVVMGRSPIRLCLKEQKLAALLKERRLLLLDYLFAPAGDAESDRPGIYKIGFDRHGSLHEMLKLLRAAGHRRIAISSGLMQFFGELTSEERGTVLLPFPEKAAERNASWRAGLLAQVTGLMEERGCTAVMLGDDMKAISLIAGLLKAGRRVPDDISVVGYEGIAAAEFTQVPLTTVQVPTAGIVDVAADLLKRGAGESDDAHQSVYKLPCTIIKRESLGPAPARS